MIAEKPPKELLVQIMKASGNQTLAAPGEIEQIRDNTRAERERYIGNEKTMSAQTGLFENK